MNLDKKQDRLIEKYKSCINETNDIDSDIKSLLKKKEKLEHKSYIIMVKLEEVVRDRYNLDFLKKMGLKKIGVKQ